MAGSTKSRLRRSNDNGLVESNRGSVVCTVGLRAHPGVQTPSTPSASASKSRTRKLTATGRASLRGTPVGQRKYDKEMECGLDRCDDVLCLRTAR